MADHSSIIARRNKRRESPLELAPGKTVTVRRPEETDVANLWSGFTLDLACAYVVGWSGFTEADALGADQAPEDALEFSEPLWRSMVADNMEWFAMVKAKLFEVVVEHFKAKGAAAKN